jgi:hypothetical protein
LLFLFLSRKASFFPGIMRVLASVWFTEGRRRKWSIEMKNWQYITVYRFWLFWSLATLKIFLHLMLQYQTLLFHVKCYQIREPIGNSRIIWITSRFDGVLKSYDKAHYRTSSNISPLLLVRLMGSFSSADWVPRRSACWT